MNKLKYLAIAIVIGISAFTHLYRIDKTYIFNNDEGRDALIAYRMIQTKSPVILGPETSVGNMYLGPFYYYLMVPGLVLSRLDPVGPAIMVGLLGIITTTLLIYLGKRRYTLGVGLVAGLFYALSPIMVFSSRSSWNPNVIPFFITLLLLVYPCKKIWQSLIFGILTGIIFQLHYVALVVPALLLLRDLYLAARSRSWKQLLFHIGYIFIGFLISSSPFWIFEARHNFVNSQAFFTYLLQKGGGVDLGYPPFIVRFITNFNLLITGILGSASVVSVPLSWLTWIGAVTTIIFYLFVVRGTYSYLIVASLLIISLLKENIYIHYISFLFPIISLVVGSSIARRGLLKIPAYVLLVSLIFPTYSSLKYNIGDSLSSQPRRASEAAAYIVKTASGRPYNVVNATTSSSSTILYYLAISSNPPQNQDESLLFVICERALCSDDILTRSDLFLNGPSHPTLINYLGYTPRLDSQEKRVMISNEWVTYDIYIATVTNQP